MTIHQFLHQRVLGNTVDQLMVSGIILLFGFLLRRLLSRLVSTVFYRLTKRYTAGVSERELSALLIKPLSVLLFLFTLYLAFSVLDYPLKASELERNEPWPKMLAFRLYQLGVIAALTWVVLRLIDFAVLVYRRRAELMAATPAAAAANRRLDNQFIPFAKDFLKVLVLIMAFLVMLGQVFSVNVTALIGGLGIGGLAVAFAAKESLENLIASFTIFLDQPFVVGDLVSVGDLTGTVEKIGFRSTRIRTVEKSYVTVPNKSMIDKPLDNLSRRTARRVFFMMSLTQMTRSDQLHRILDGVRAAISAHELIQPDIQVKFTSLTSNSKDVRVQYYVATDSYDEYLNVMEEINFQIVSVVEQNGAHFVDTTMTRLAGELSGAGTDLPRSLQQSGGQSIANS